MELTILPDRQAVVATTADTVEQFVTSFPNSFLGLSGGSGPPIIHQTLTERSIPWDRVTTWMTDERWVGPDDEASNQRMARQTLVDPTGVRFLAPDTTLQDPEAASSLFEVELGESGIGGETASAVMLGMGPDGHTASLFPGTSALTDTDHSYVANWVEQHNTWRLTATYPLLATADLVLIIVMGKSKAAMIAAIAGGIDVPAARVRCRGQVRWILDEAAASML